MSGNVTIGQILRRPGPELINGGREVATVLGFSFLPLVVAAAMFALKDYVDALPEVKDYWAMFSASLEKTIGGAHLLLYSLASLGSVAGKIWPPSQIRFHHTWAFNCLIFALALIAGALIGVDPTLQKLQHVPIFWIALGLYALCTFMVFIVTVAYNVSAPDVQASSQASITGLGQKLKTRRKARKNGP